MDKHSIWIGFDPREASCFAVARSSIKRRLTTPLPIYGLALGDLQGRGYYRRPLRVEGNQLYDEISRAPMATEFAISRFLTPILAKEGLALFIDCDIMSRVNIAELFDLADPEKAVQCVQHSHVPTKSVKMDGVAQTTYSRKNWSSVMLFNCDHPANQRLTVDVVNTFPGLNLHNFCWLKDDEIGELPPRYNYLVGHTQLEEGEEPALVHWTDGAPCIRGYENEEYSGEFWQELYRWVR